MRLAALKAVIPYRYVEAARRVVHYGTAERCGFCGAGLRQLGASGYGYPVLEELEVVGGLLVAHDRCPVCHAGHRERLVRLFLEQHEDQWRRPGARVLHFAPEKSLSGWLSRMDGLDYRAADIEPRRYWHLKHVMQLNLLGLALPDASVDLIICNHVLEHIPDDRRAMRELRRVLAPGGMAVLQVPIALALASTREGDGSESPADKIRLYGQDDHVRIYTRADYVARLREAGFAVTEYNAFAEQPEAARRLRLEPREVLFCARA